MARIKVSCVNCNRFGFRSEFSARNGIFTCRDSASCARRMKERSNARAEGETGPYRGSWEIKVDNL